MKLQQVLCLCMLLVSAWATVFEEIGGGVRGNRPVEAAYKADSCAQEADWPMCTDLDWGYKCPSGCRIQGLLDNTDHDILTRIDKIRQLLDENRNRYRTADQSSKDTYDYLRERLTTSSGNENKYMSLAESLRQRIVDIKVKIERQLNILEALKARVRQQVIEMQRLEVDIDIKLRACKGSCAEYAEFSVDRESYVALDKQLDQLESIRVNSVETVGALRVMKSRVLKEVLVPSIYKSGLPGSEAEQQRQYFPDIGQPELTLHGERGPVRTQPLTASSSSSSPHSSSPSSPHSSSSSSHYSSSSSPHSSSLSGPDSSSSSSYHSSSSYPHSSSSSAHYSSSSSPHSSSSSLPHSSSSTHYSSSSSPHSSSSSSFPHSSSSSFSGSSSSSYPHSSSSSSSFPHSSSSSSSSFPHSSSSSSSSFPHSSSSTSHTSASSSKCSRTIRKVVTHTKDGPVEKTEEVLTGDGCDALEGGHRPLTSFGHGDLKDFFGGGDPFKRFESAFGDMSSPFGSSSSAGSSKTMSSSKSLLSGTKSASGFSRGGVDDDLPDAFAHKK